MQKVSWFTPGLILGVLQQWDKVPEDIGEAELAEDDHLINRKEQDLNGLDDFPPLVTGQVKQPCWIHARIAALNTSTASMKILPVACVTSQALWLTVGKAAGTAWNMDRGLQALAFVRENCQSEEHIRIREGAWLWEEDPHWVGHGAWSPYSCGCCRPQGQGSISGKHMSLLLYISEGKTSVDIQIWSQAIRQAHFTCRTSIFNHRFQQHHSLSNAAFWRNCRGVCRRSLLLKFRSSWFRNEELWQMVIASILPWCLLWNSSTAWFSWKRMMQMAD